VQAKDRLGHLIGVSETLIELTAATGVETDDTRFIEAVQQAAAAVSKLFEAAVARGDIALEDLFDQHYVPVAGTNPPQLLTRFTTFTDRVLPAIQEPPLELDARVALGCRADRLQSVNARGRCAAHSRRSAREMRRFRLPSPRACARRAA
jgi:methyl-accepting chemotaxis protein